MKSMIRVGQNKLPNEFHILSHLDAWKTINSKMPNLRIYLVTNLGKSKIMRKNVPDNRQGLIKMMAMIPKRASNIREMTKKSTATLYHQGNKTETLKVMMRNSINLSERNKMISDIFHTTNVNIIRVGKIKNNRQLRKSKCHAVKESFDLIYLPPIKQFPA